MQLVERPGAHALSTEPKFFLDPLHPINQKLSCSGWRFECARTDDITDGMIGRVSQPGHDREWTTGDGVRDRILIIG